MQDVMVEVLEGAVPPDAPLEPWIERRVMRRARSGAERAGGREQLHHEYAYLAALPRAATPQQALAIKVAVQNAVHTLAGDAHEAVWRCLGMGDGLREVAHDLRVSTATLYRRLKAAVQVLRGALQEYAPGRRARTRRWV